MAEITSRLSTALADRYWIERRLGEGGMAISYQLSAISHQLRRRYQRQNSRAAAISRGNASGD